MMKNFQIAIFISALILLNLLSSCNDKSSETASSIDGTWESVGYGRVVKIEDGEFIMAEISAVSCIPVIDGELEMFGDTLQFKNDTISLLDGINTYYFTRIPDVPSICKKDTPEWTKAAAKANDPIYNFDVLWHTFNEHYAYFDLRKINWDSSYAKYRPQVTPETTPAALFKIMNEMLNEFDDGHIGLDAPSEVEQEAYPETDQTKSDDTRGRLYSYMVAERVAEKYIPNGKAIKNNNLRWGILDGNVGYVQCNQMMGLAEFNLSDTLSFREYWMTYMEKIENVPDSTLEELKGVNNALDSLMEDLKNTDALIVDVRFNGGGKDEVGLALLERLNDSEKVVFTKKGRLGDGFTPLIQVRQTASEVPYLKPVYLLTSPESASATEIMTLSSLSIPHITRIGSNTEGVFSDILDRMLPNGWEFDLSSEVYESMDGTNYEGVGIPADIELDYSRNTQDFYHSIVDALFEGGDEAINKALELAKEQ